MAQQYYEKNYFTYKGVNYGYGTVVQLKLDYPHYNIKKCNGIAIFCKGNTSGILGFKGMLPPGERNCIIGYMDSMPEDIIDHIIEPVYVDVIPVWQVALNNYMHTDPDKRPDTFIGTLWYFVIMIGGTLFYDRVIIWIVATAMYFGYLINRYRN